MKREDLEAMGLSKENIDKIMAQNGQDIENAKANAAGSAADKARADRLQEQLDSVLAELNVAQQEGATAAQLRKTLAETTAKLDAANKSNDVRAILERDYKPKDVSLIMKLLDHGKIVKGEDGNYTGIAEQVDPLRTASAYLFSDTPDPQGGNPNAGTSGAAFDMNAFLRS